MFKHIVVGVDGRAGGREAIALAQQLLAGDGELTLAHVFPNDPQLIADVPSHANGREHAYELLMNTRRELRLDAQVRWRGAPSVGRGLHELCETDEADLLVVGSSGRGLLGRVLMGDDTGAALNGAPCAIAIAPAGYSPGISAMREIGVGYDGSPESVHALTVARQLAGESGANLSALQAVSLPAVALVGAMLPLSEIVQGLIDDARARIASLGGVEPHAAFGAPAEELAVHSAALDLLVVGSRGYGPAGRLIHGSTSERLARTARCPLLVLPRAAAPAEVSHAPSAGAEGATAPAV